MPNGSQAAAGKWRRLEVTIASASSEATAAASTWRSEGLIGHRRLQRGDGGFRDLRIVERASHSVDQVRGLLGGCPLILDQVAGHLIENSAAPANR
jgi:hypothetical protein